MCVVLGRGGGVGFFVLVEVDVVFVVNAVESGSDFVEAGVKNVTSGNLAGV